MCLSLSELLEDVDKGGMPLSEQVHVAFVICGMDQPCVHGFAGREGAGRACLGSYAGHSRRIHVSRSDDPTGEQHA